MAKPGGSKMKVYKLWTKLLNPPYALKMKWFTEASLPEDDVAGSWDVLAAVYLLHPEVAWLHMPLLPTRLHVLRQIPGTWLKHVCYTIGTERHHHLRASL